MCRYTHGRRAVGRSQRNPIARLSTSGSIGTRLANNIRFLYPFGRREPGRRLHLSFYSRRTVPCAGVARHGVYVSRVVPLILMAY